MITVYVNQIPIQVKEKTSLQHILELSLQQLDVKLDNIAAVHNQHIVPKSQWPNSACKDNDQIELFSAVAGG